MFKAIYKFITGVLDFIKNYFFILLFLFIVIAYFADTKQEALEKPNLMRIDIAGPIIESDTFLKKIDEAKKADIKGVLVYINSPGGLVAPSIEMSLAIKRLKSLKPVVVYAGGVMASGSYYAGIWADKIVANPGSIVGSIGVIFDGFDISGLIKKVGIKEQVAKMGKYKEAGTIFREWSKPEKEEIDKLLKDTYDMFVADVARARGLKMKDREKFADAHVFSAFRAKEVGLVDEVGSIYRAKQILISESGVIEPRWKKRDKLEEYLSKLAEGAVNKMALFFGAGLRSSIR